MPRIYKGTAATLKLLIPTCHLDSELTDVSVTLYTDPKDGTTVFTRNIEIDGNILTLEFPVYALAKNSDGVINYIVKGKLDGEQFLVQRQSNYYLKTPDGFDADAYPNPGDVKVTSLEATITENGTFSFIPETDEHFNPIELWEGATITVDVPAEEGGDCNLEEKRIEPSMGEMDENGYIVVEEDEGYDGLSRVIINPQTIYNEGIEEGKNQGGGSVDCNLEDKWVTPSMDERDGNGLIVVSPSEGYDGMSRTVIDPQTIYNEGLEAGKAEGGEGGSCNLGILDWTLTEPYGSQKNATDDGYDGYEAVVVRPENIIAQQREEAINDFKNKLKEITITENGRYSIDDTESRNYIEFDGNSYFDTNIPFGENTKIEVAITKTTYEEEEQVIGVAAFDLLVAETYGGFGIVVGAGLTYGVFGNAKTLNIPFSYEEEQILTLDRNGIKSSLYGERDWIDESGLVYDGLYGQTIGIGKIKSVSDGWIHRGLNGRIRYVKIWTDGNDDSTLVTFIPKNAAQGAFGMVNSEGTEYNYVENLGEGTATFISELVQLNPYGWKHIDVNVVSPFTTQEISYSVYQNLTKYDNNTIYLISE